jgi:autotransporter-associated beta strand protein
MGDFGFTAQVTFQGAATGNANMVLKGGNNAYMRYAGASSLYGGSLVVEGTAAVIPLNTSTIGNAIEIRGATSVLRANVASGTQATWNGVLSGNGTLSLQQVLVGTTTNQVSGTNDGMGTLVLAGSLNTHTGAINVNTGKLQVDGLIAASAQNVVVGTSGALGGSGTINRNVTVNGILAPGNSPGLLTVNGNVTLSSTALFSAELNGNTAGTGYDQLAVNGGVTLGSAALTIVPGFAAAFTDRIFIVVNDAADAISGTFNGLAEGASVSFVFGGDTYTGLITYVADSTTNSLSGGNDIALHSFAIPEPSAGMVLVVLAGLAVARRRRA